MALALSKRAGCILAIANSLEMAFLGMAVSIRVRKCTGSSTFVRYACITVPPLIMLAATMLGSLAGSISKELAMAKMQPALLLRARATPIRNPSTKL